MKTTISKSNYNKLAKAARLIKEANQLIDDAIENDRNIWHTGNMLSIQSQVNWCDGALQNDLEYFLQTKK